VRLFFPSTFILAYSSILHTYIFNDEKRNNHNYTILSIYTYSGYCFTTKLIVHRSTACRVKERRKRLFYSPFLRILCHEEITREERIIASTRYFAIHARRTEKYKNVCFQGISNVSSRNLRWGSLRNSPFASRSQGLKHGERSPGPRGFRHRLSLVALVVLHRQLRQFANQRGICLHHSE